MSEKKYRKLNQYQIEMLRWMCRECARNKSNTVWVPGDRMVTAHAFRRRGLLEYVGVGHWRVTDKVGELL